MHVIAQLGTGLKTAPMSVSSIYADQGRHRLFWSNWDRVASPTKSVQKWVSLPGVEFGSLAKYIIRLKLGVKQCDLKPTELLDC